MSLCTRPTSARAPGLSSLECDREAVRPSARPPPTLPLPPLPPHPRDPAACEPLSEAVAAGDPTEGADRVRHLYRALSVGAAGASMIWGLRWAALLCLILCALHWTNTPPKQRALADVTASLSIVLAAAWSSLARTAFLDHLGGWFNPGS